MKVKEFAIKGPLLIEPAVFHDARGWFSERFKVEAFAELGIKNNFVQDNFSLSLPGVLRGLHYQFDPPQGKLVTCVQGKVFDVAVDIRKGSPTFGQHIVIELSANEPKWCWIPAGFAHGFCVIGNDPAGLMYKVDNYWSKAGESGILYSDPDLDIQWPVASPIVSDKDRVLQKFQDYKANAKFNV